MKKILIFIVSYNAESTIVSVLERIPAELFEDKDTCVDVLIVDDASTDNTIEAFHKYQNHPAESRVCVLKNPTNLGYGGNQKVGFQYAINNGYDYVVLLHGDGQYAPEEMPRLLQPLIEGTADAVFGSRMLESGNALKGGMPKYKYVGNKILTTIQNSLVGTRLSEYHSGYRLYSVEALSSLAFQSNSNDFDFDTDIIVQLHNADMRIAELPIPTFYGDEICHVNGIQYALKILRTCAAYRAQQMRLFYDPKFAKPGHQQEVYNSKFSFNSTHSQAMEFVAPDQRLLAFGSGGHDLVKPFVDKGATLVAIDHHIKPDLEAICETTLSKDIDKISVEELQKLGKFNQSIALDIIEHLNEPEAFLRKLRDSGILENAQIMITTPNIGFITMRIGLLFGQFNYGESGILDKTHSRLFTFKSLKQLLLQAGYDINSIKGVPAPFPLALSGQTPLAKFLLGLNSGLIKIMRNLFSFQLTVVATPRPTVDQLLERTIKITEDNQV